VAEVLVGKPEGKRSLGRPRRRWMGSKWILGRLSGGVEWIQLVQDGGPMAGSSKHGNEPSGSGATELVG
jgi:hypothetical protein